MKSPSSFLNPIIGQHYKVIGDLNNLDIRELSEVFCSDKYSLIFCNNAFFQRNKNKFQKKIRANCLVTDLSLDNIKCLFQADITIISSDPKLIYAYIANNFLSGFQDIKTGIHPSAIIHKKAIIHPSAYIGPLNYIGNCKIGAYTYIEGSCHIKDNVLIGKNCWIDAGVVIGVEGTGHIQNKKKEWIKFPQIGKTIIEDNVEIGANTYVTRGALGNTRIKKGAIIGLDCGIGHNAIIEKNAFVTSKAIIGGSSVIGKNSIVGMNALIRDAVVIGKNTRIGMGAVVTKNVPDNEEWAGNPARPISELKKFLSKLKED